MSVTQQKFWNPTVLPDPSYTWHAPTIRHILQEHVVDTDYTFDEVVAQLDVRVYDEQIVTLYSRLARYVMRWDHTNFRVLAPHLSQRPKITDAYRLNTLKSLWFTHCTALCAHTINLHKFTELDKGLFIIDSSFEPSAEEIEEDEISDVAQEAFGWLDPAKLRLPRTLLRLCLIRSEHVPAELWSAVWRHAPKHLKTLWWREMPFELLPRAVEQNFTVPPGLNVLDLTGSPALSTRLINWSISGGKHLAFLWFLGLSSVLDDVSVLQQLVASFPRLRLLQITSTEEEVDQELVSSWEQAIQQLPTDTLLEVRLQSNRGEIAALHTAGWDASPQSGEAILEQAKRLEESVTQVTQYPLAQPSPEEVERVDREWEETGEGEEEGDHEDDDQGNEEEEDEGTFMGQVEDAYDNIPEDDPSTPAPRQYQYQHRRRSTVVTPPQRPAAASPLSHNKRPRPKSKTRSRPSPKRTANPPQSPKDPPKDPPKEPTFPVSTYHDSCMEKADHGNRYIQSEWVIPAELEVLPVVMQYKRMFGQTQPPEMLRKAFDAQKDRIVRGQFVNDDSFLSTSTFAQRYAVLEELKRGTEHLVDDRRLFGTYPIGLMSSSIIVQPSSEPLTHDELVFEYRRAAQVMLLYLSGHEQPETLASTITSRLRKMLDKFFDAPADRRTQSNELALWRNLLSPRGGYGNVRTHLLTRADERSSHRRQYHANMMGLIIEEGNVIFSARYLVETVDKNRNSLLKAAAVKWMLHVLSVWEVLWRCEPRLVSLMSAAQTYKRVAEFIEEVRSLGSLEHCIHLKTAAYAQEVLGPWQEEFVEGLRRLSDVQFE